jgi:hypothetical protein
MHASDILKYGHSFILHAVEGLNLETPDWDISGACGVWSMREIIAHLATFEIGLIEVCQLLLDENSPTPFLQQMRSYGVEFNDYQVGLRSKQTPAESWQEYESNFEKCLALFNQIPVEKHRQTGILAWYGSEYDLEDFPVYMYYGHKREHGAQINAFRDILKQRDE